MAPKELYEVVEVYDWDFMVDDDYCIIGKPLGVDKVMVISIYALQGLFECACRAGIFKAPMGTVYKVRWEEKEFSDAKDKKGPVKEDVGASTIPYGSFWRISETVTRHFCRSAS